MIRNTNEPTYRTRMAKEDLRRTRLRNPLWSSTHLFSGETVLWILHVDYASRPTGRRYHYIVAQVQYMIKKSCATTT